MKKTKNAGLLAIVIGVALYLVASPYITVHQMKVAAEKRDGEALSEHIDYPSVRQSLKDQLKAELVKELAEEEAADNPFAALGTLMASAIVDGLVDVFVTPTGMRYLMSGESISLEEATTEGVEEAPAQPLFKNASMGYEGLNKFVVKVPGDFEEEAVFVMRREGLKWKITEIVVPLD